MYIYVLWCSLKKIAGSEAMRMAQCEVLIMVLQFAQSLLLVGAKVKLGRIRVLTPTPAPTPPPSPLPRQTWILTIRENYVQRISGTES